MRLRARSHRFCHVEAPCPLIARTKIEHLMKLLNRHCLPWELSQETICMIPIDIVCLRKVSRKSRNCTDWPIATWSSNPHFSKIYSNDTTSIVSRRCDAALLLISRGEADSGSQSYSHYGREEAWSDVRWSTMFCNLHVISCTKYETSSGCTARLPRPFQRHRLTRDSRPCFPTGRSLVVAKAHVTQKECLVLGSVFIEPKKI